MCSNVVKCFDWFPSWFPIYRWWIAIMFLCLCLISHVWFWIDTYDTGGRIHSHHVISSPCKPFSWGSSYLSSTTDLSFESPWRLPTPTEVLSPSPGHSDWSTTTIRPGSSKNNHPGQGQDQIQVKTSIERKTPAAPAPPGSMLKVMVKTAKVHLDGQRQCPPESLLRSSPTLECALAWEGDTDLGWYMLCASFRRLWSVVWDEDERLVVGRRSNSFLFFILLSMVGTRKAMIPWWPLNPWILGVQRHHRWVWHASMVYRPNNILQHQREQTWTTKPIGLKQLHRKWREACQAWKLGKLMIKLKSYSCWKQCFQMRVFGSSWRWWPCPCGAGRGRIVSTAARCRQPLAAGETSRTRLLGLLGGVEERALLVLRCHSCQLRYFPFWVRSAGDVNLLLPDCGVPPGFPLSLSLSGFRFSQTDAHFLQRGSVVPFVLWLTPGKQWWNAQATFIGMQQQDTSEGYHRGARWKHR